MLPSRGAASNGTTLRAIEATRLFGDVLARNIDGSAHRFRRVLREIVGK